MSMASRSLKRKTKAAIDYSTASQSVRGYHLHKNGLLNVAPKTTTQATLAQTNKTTSPLLRLPAELRNMIWMAIFRNIVFENTKRGRRKRFVATGGQAQPLSLLRTCRQVYAETAFLPYQESLFRVNTVMFANRALRYMRPAYREHITKLELPAFSDIQKMRLRNPNGWDGETPYEVMDRLLPNLATVTSAGITEDWETYGTFPGHWFL